MKQAHGLIEGLQAKYVLVDKAYDADSLIQTIHDNNAKACIPPKTNRLKQRAYDKDLYKERISSNLCSANSSKHAWDPSNAPKYIYGSNS